MVALLAAAAPATASASATSCAKDVIHDWEDNGVVDKTYAAGCYAWALRELPEDARLYSSAESDILAARARSVPVRNSSRSLQSARVRSTARVDTSSGASSSVKELAAVTAAVATGAVAIFVRLRRRAKRM